jgi:hypothetical protein
MRLALSLSVVLMLRASASLAAPPPSAMFDRDRAAILAMAGRYRVTFDFKETVALKDGYTLASPQHSGGTEMVVVAEDTGRTIDLQHILVLGEDKTVVKHWRQRWEYESRDRLEFRGSHTFARRRISGSDVKGTWMQSVFEVDDAPRYQGHGRWRHEDGVSSWESYETWRPLPRREYTKRSDYDVIVARNRHTLMPGGWVHEQDNLKLDLRAGESEALAREVGLNRYERTSEWDFTAGEAYWSSTAPFWNDVRRAWARVLAQPTVVVDDKDGNGKPRYERFFALAEEVRSSGRYDADALRPRLADVFASFVHAPAPRSASSGTRAIEIR